MVNNQETEYVCYTCETNSNIEKVAQREEETPRDKPVWINIRSRKTKKGVGLCFTKNSIFFNYHLRDDIDHDWGNVAQMEKQLEDEKALEKLAKELDAEKKTQKIEA